MRYIRYVCIAIFAMALVTVALANRGLVELRLWPEQFSGLAAVDPTITLPLFVVIFGGLVAGLIVGFIWEWLREAGDRAKVGRQAREIKKLQEEIRQLKGEKHEGKDEVLALLEEVS